MKNKTEILVENRIFCSGHKAILHSVDVVSSGAM